MTLFKAGTRVLTGLSECHVLSASVIGGEPS